MTSITLEAWAARALKVLLAVEWPDADETGVCPVCMRGDAVGHAQNCELAALLADYQHTQRRNTDV